VVHLLTAKVKCKRGKVFSLLNKASLNEDILESGGITPRILDLGTSWK
jgi:hypothetical protein